MRPTETSATKIRSGTPTCVAARPMPGAAYIVWIMSSIELLDVGRDLGDGRGGLVEHLVAVAEDRTDHRSRSVPLA